jgi:hypothetical protein
MRWLVIASVAMVSGCSGESEWVQKCVLNGKARAVCACLDKELKPEWRDYALLGDDDRFGVLATMSPDAFKGVSDAEAKCLTPS